MSEVISLCGSVGKNTGKMKCDTRRGVPRVAIIGGGTYDASQYATSIAFKQALLDSINLATGDGEKMYPFPEVQNVANNTEANTTAATGLGFQFVLREGKPGYTFGVLIGSNLEKSLRAFNGEIVPVMIFDNKGNVWGKLDSEDNFVGVDALIFTTGKPYSDGNSVDAEYTLVSISFTSAQDFFDFAAYVPTDFNVSNLDGLLDVNLTYLSNSTNAYKIQGIIPNTDLSNQQYIEKKYGTELASSTLWEAFTGVTFATPLTLTGVTDDTANKAHTVTFDSTLYAALASGAKILLRLKSPTVLKAADVVGIEGVSVILTKP